MELVNYLLERPIFAVFIVIMLVMAIKLVKKILAKNKAQLSIVLEDDTVEFNQQLLGLVKVKALKSLQIEKIRCRLKIYVEKQAGNNSKRQRLYKSEFEYSNLVTLRQGQQQEFNFTLDMPNKNVHQDLLNNIQNLLDNRYKVKCIITVKVYCDGVNLQKSKNLIYIHKGFNL